MPGRIVVGVDGSDPSKAALRWAVSEADLRGAELELVHSYTTPVYGDVSGIGVAAMAIDDEALRSQARKVADDMAAEVGGRAGGRPIVTRAVLGPAGPVLEEASKDADLVVVGARGLGGLRTLLLGSVSQHVSRHAHCPVVIVRDR